MSLQSAKAAHEICTGCWEGGDWENKANMWSIKWFPFLQHWGGDLLCVDMEGSFGGESGQVLYFYHDSDDRTVQFPSLEKWLVAFVVSLEAGMWQEDQYGFQPKDYDRVAALFKEMNPGYPSYCEAG